MNASTHQILQHFPTKSCNDYKIKGYNKFFVPKSFVDQPKLPSTSDMPHLTISGLLLVRKLEKSFKICHIFGIRK